MIENYKGWDITLNWDDRDYLGRDITKSNLFNQKEIDHNNQCIDLYYQNQNFQKFLLLKQ